MAFEQLQVSLDLIAIQLLIRGVCVFCFNLRKLLQGIELRIKTAAIKKPPLDLSAVNCGG